VYAREVDGRVLTLAVSGMLWERSLVMVDQETGSLWSHILGTAKQGPLRGKQLEQIPSVMTDWKSWSRAHPEGTVALLSRTSRDYGTEFYRHPAHFVLGIAQGGEAMAWSFDALQRSPAINDTYRDQPVVVLMDADSVTARLFSRRVGDRTLTFEYRDGTFRDRESGSTWDPITGRAVDGPQRGAYLQALPAIVSYRHTWKVFHPQSR
jgi:hypothetical protein